MRRGIFQAVLILTGLIAGAATNTRGAEATPAGSASASASGQSVRDPVREGPRIVPGAPLGVGRLVPDLDFSPRSGKAFRLGDLKPRVATVIAFTSTSCPVTRRYAPTLAALEREFGPLGVQFVFVNAIASDDSKDMAEAVRTHGFKAPYVHDAAGKIAAALDARSTAEVFVLDAARTLVYRGAIDDQYGLGYSLDGPRRRFLVDALKALADGKAPEVTAATAPGCALDRSGAVAATAVAAKVPVTYHNRISRIVQQHCEECHRPGGIAPFSLGTPAELASHAGMIRKVIDRGVMPPWFAAPTPGQAAGGHSPWTNDRSLPAADREDLLAWLAGNRAEGNPADAPLARSYPKDWEIGEPDVVFQIPEPIEVKATGRMPYQEVYVETKLAEDRWVSALEVRPTARDVVHHVLVFVVPPDKNATNGAPRKRRGGDTGAGNFFAVYVPGNNVLAYAPGFAKHLPAGSALHFQIHYTPTGTATRDQTRLGLKWAKEPPRHEVRVAAIAPPVLRIPAGAANHEVPAIIPVPFHAKLMSFMPHMHVRGKAYRYELEDPQGRRTLLLDVPHYDFNWQLQYRLAEPIDAPVGSRLHGTAWYDNSADNPANPDPTREVKWGIQTEDEMALGYLEFYVPELPPGTKVASIPGAGPRGGGGGGSGGAVFATLDRNGDGVITPEEAPAPEVFKQADADNDGKVTREELRDFLRKQRRK